MILKGLVLYQKDEKYIYLNDLHIYYDNLKNLFEHLVLNEIENDDLIRFTIKIFKLLYLNQIYKQAMVNQFDINSDGDLEFITYQRSADVFLGLPYNIVFYSTFCHMVAQVLGLKCTKMIYHLGNTHLYENCLEQAKIQLSRDGYPDPILSLNPDIKDFDSFRIQDLKVSGYRHHGFLKAPVAV